MVYCEYKYYIFIFLEKHIFIIETPKATRKSLYDVIILVTLRLIEKESYSYKVIFILLFAYYFFVIFF